MPSVKGVIKRSSSKLGAGKGSIAHIGSTPSKFRLDFFIQFVDGVKSDDAVCVVWERRDTLLATKAVMAKDSKAVFRENLTMQVTLFRRNDSGGDGPKFDEKKAKFALKQNDADGKTLAKVHLNLADYVKGSTGTTFADIKLSGGVVMATKIEATFLSSGKGKGGGDGASSKMSAITTGSGGLNDVDSSIGDDDSIFDDGDLEDLDDLGEPARASGGKSGAAPSSPVASASGPASPSSSVLTSSSVAGTPSKKEEKKEKKEKKKAAKESKQAAKEAKESGEGGEKGDSPSKSSSKRILSKISKKVEKTGSTIGIEKKAKKAAAAAAAASAASAASAADGSAAAGASSDSLRSGPEKDSAPLVAELRKRVAALERSNGRLQLELKDANAEMDALQAELEAATSSELSGTKAASEAKKQKDLIKALQREVHTLKLENAGLVEELDERAGDEEDDSSLSLTRLNQKNAQLTSEIQDLTQKLGREPEFLKVVEQLKVIKVQLATAIEDKEQALFLLKQSTRGVNSTTSFSALGTPISESSSYYSIGGAV
ncbi:hypothetical protein MMPV_000187 [Pyropia vietnamensis]